MNILYMHTFNTSLSQMAMQWPSASSIPSTLARFVVTVQTAAAVIKYESDVPFFFQLLSSIFVSYSRFSIFVFLLSLLHSVLTYFL